jgi:hypothetical protein
LILPRHDKIAAQFNERVTITFDSIAWPGTRGSLELSEKMLQDYPAIWTPEGFVLAPEFLAKIEQYVDWDYFRRTTLCAPG